VLLLFETAATLEDQNNLIYTRTHTHTYQIEKKNISRKSYKYLW